MNAFSSMPMTPGTATADAVVTLRDGETLTVTREGMRFTARRAVSCLVQPEPGDLVLLGGSAACLYVLAILERQGDRPLRLAAAGDMEIAAEGGRLSLDAETLVVTAPQGQIAVRDLALSGSKVTARYGAITLLAEAIESLATRLMTRVKRSYRFVEETEHLRARDIDQRASSHLHLRGETAMLQGGTLAKVDAKQIHMG